MVLRCGWVDLNDPLYVKYHDEEWGKPVHDDQILFEFLTLEGAQAGLSWRTVLHKRESYRRLFDGFDVQKIARYDDAKIEALLQDARIIRNRLKVKSVVKNAQVFLRIQEEFGSFDTYLLGHLKRHKMHQNKVTSLTGIPVRSEVSDALSKDLKKRGMSFVGTTIMYAFMQAIGMVNDHEQACAFRKERGVRQDGL